MVFIFSALLFSLITYLKIVSNTNTHNILPFSGIASIPIIILPMLFWLITSDTEMNFHRPSINTAWCSPISSLLGSWSLNQPIHVNCSDFLPARIAFHLLKLKTRRSAENCFFLIRAFEILFLQTLDLLFGC